MFVQGFMMCGKASMMWLEMYQVLVKLGKWEAK